LRASESIGFNRPLKTSGNWPNSLKAKSVSAAGAACQEPRGERGGQNQRHPLFQFFHFIFLFDRKPTRWNMNWVTSPRATMRTADVGRQPAWVVHDLQHRRRRAPGLARRLARVHLILIKRQSGVAQRMVHGDFHLAVLARLRIAQLDAAAEILRDVRAFIDRVRRLQQLQRKGEINALRTQREGEFLSAGFDGLRAASTGRQFSGPSAGPTAARNLAANASTISSSDVQPETTQSPSEPFAPMISIRAVGTFFSSMLFVSAAGGKSKLAPTPFVVSGGPFFIIGARNDGSEFSQ
jgi:hypothetical protein